MYFYPRSPCGERRESRQPCGHPTRDFYPRSPCGERLCNRRLRAIHNTFLSTLSLRRATLRSLHRLHANHDFYPRSPCGERQEHRSAVHQGCGISIHALLAESDGYGKERLARLYKFLSTLSLRRATEKVGFTRQLVEISIHALLAESDSHSFSI